MNIWLESEESSSSDDELYALLCNEMEVEDEDFLECTIPRCDDTQFIKHFRVSRQLVNDLSVRFSYSKYYHYQNGQFGKLSSDAYILIFLWFAGQQAASYRDVANKFGIALGTLRKVIEKVMYFLSNLSPEVIKWPTAEAQMHMKKQFDIYGFHDVIGVIGGCHVQVDKPSEDPDSYLNKNNHYSMKFQVVCDHEGRICDVMIGYPGSANNSTVFAASSLVKSLRKKCGDNYILGDSSYPCLKNLLTPYRDNGNLRKKQLNYNIKLSKTRGVIEHCFGLLKQKFKKLYHLKLKGDNDIANFIRACCVLHNLALDNEFPSEKDEQVPEQLPPDYSNVSRDTKDGKELRDTICKTLPLE